MDSMSITTIAVASIVVSGMTIAFGSLGACAGGRKGGRDGAELAGSAARRVRDHHADPVRRPRDDRVAGHLLLRGLDDSHFRQSFLALRHRPGRGKVAHAHRLVHRRRASAQLRHPRVADEALSLQARPRTPSTRGRSGSPRSSRTPLRRRPRPQKERDEFQHKNEEFDQQRAALLKQGDGRGGGRASAAPRRGSARRPTP